MLTAIRRGRHQPSSSPSPANDVPLEAVARQCAQAAQRVARTVNEWREAAGGWVEASIAAAGPRPELALAFASISGASKPGAKSANSRKIEAAKAISLADYAASGSGAEPAAAATGGDAAPPPSEERILISEARNAAEPAEPAPAHKAARTSVIRRPTGRPTPTHPHTHAQIDVAGVDGELREIALRALSTRPNFAYTIQEIQDDVKRVFDTGYFQETAPHATDTRDGILLTVNVVPNPELRGFVVTGAGALPQASSRRAAPAGRGAGPGGLRGLPPAGGCASRPRAGAGHRCRRTCRLACTPTHRPTRALPHRGRCAAPAGAGGSGGRAAPAAGPHAQLQHARARRAHAQRLVRGRAAFRCALLR